MSTVSSNGAGGEAALRAVVSRPPTSQATPGIVAAIIGTAAKYVHLRLNGIAVLAPLDK
jgi:hypothetical protein